METNFDLVAEAVYCFNQSTPEMYDANWELALDHECRLYELFKSFTPKDTETYQRHIDVYEVAVADF